MTLNLSKIENCPPQDSHRCGARDESGVVHRNGKPVVVKRKTSIWRNEKTPLFTCLSLVYFTVSEVSHRD